MKVGALWVIRAPGAGGVFQRVLALYLCFGSVTLVRGFPGGSDGKESVCITGDLGSIPGSGRSPREGNGYPLQYSCLENPMGRGTWWATVLGDSESNRTEQINNESGLGSAFTVLKEGEGRQAGTQLGACPVIKARDAGGLNKAAASKGWMG